MMKPTLKKGENDSRLIGYARVSTEEQSLDMQVAALIKAGVEEADIYSEKASAVKPNKKAFANALRAAGSGDTLVVWKLDRVARSLRTMIELFDLLEAEGIKFHSLTEGIETETPGGRLILHVLCALGQFERELIVERSKAGVKAAKENGVQFGPRPKVSDTEVRRAWKQVTRKRKPMTRVAAAEELNITTMTLARRFKSLGLALEPKSNTVVIKRSKKKTASRQSNG